MSAAWTKHLERARVAWPSLAFDVAAYRAWLAAACGTGFEARLDSLDAAETALCFACGRGDPEALRLFETHYTSQIPSALRRFGSDAAFVDEVAQRVRVKLFVGTPAPIERYALGGNLGGLVRVAAIREALTLRRTVKASDGDTPMDVLAGETDPELRALKARYAAEFARAFTAAIGELSARERHLLRLNLSAGASIDDIARMYQTHRATAARWLNAARDQLAAKTRAQLQATLGIGESEVQSLLRLIRTEAPRMLESIPPDRDED